MRFLDYKVLSPITCTPSNLVFSKNNTAMIEEECNVNLSLAVGGAGDAPSSRRLQQKKTSLPFQFNNLFVRAQPKEEEEESKDVDCGGSGGKRKKLRLSTEQLNLLEESFRAHTTLAPDQKQELAQRLQLQPRQVEVWFQNRRARTKLKQTEADCEFLKKCCERLTQENRRLKTELTELRSLKPGSQFYVELRKAARLRVCSSCEKMVGAEEKNKNRALS